MKSLIIFIMKVFQLAYWFIADTLKFLWKKYPEVYTLPMAFCLWIVSASLLRWIDPTAAVYDAGVLQIPLFSILLLFTFLSVSWLTMGLLFGTARKFLKTQLKESFIKLKPWEQIKYSTGIFFLLFFSLVLLSFILS